MVPGGAGSPRGWVLSLTYGSPPSKMSHPKCLQEPFWSFPITPGLQALLHIAAAVPAQPGPSSLPPGTQQPLPLLPTPCPPPATTAEPRKAEKPLEKAGPKPHLAHQHPGGCPSPCLQPRLGPSPLQGMTAPCQPLAATPAGTVPTAGNHCSLPAPRSRPSAEGMEVHVLGPGVCSPPRSCTL